MGVRGEPRPAAEVVRLDGRFPFAKTLAIGEGEAVERPATPSGLRSLYEAVRPLSPSRDNLTLARLIAGPVDARDLYFDVRFDERALHLDRFGLGILGGWIAGELETALSPSTNSIHVGAEFGEINLKELIPFEVDLPDRDAQVSGNVALTLGLARGEGTGEAGLEDINADLNLTRIGDKALDQILLYLDPKGENSSIATLRTLLATTDLTIDQVSIPIRNGAMTIRVDYTLRAHLPRFLEQILSLVYDTSSRFEIPNLSLFKLFGQERGRQAFERLEALAPVLDAVGGSRIRVDDDGAIRVE